MKMLKDFSVFHQSIQNKEFITPLEQFLEGLLLFRYLR